MRPDTNELIIRYQKNLFAASFNICQNVQDSEDAVQECFLRYHMSGKQFESEAHVHAWLLRVVINLSKNTITSFRRRHTVPLEDYLAADTQVSDESRQLLSTVMALPEKYRIVIHLYYYEDYPVKEIAAILQISESNAKKRLSRGRLMLKEQLKEAWDDE